MDGKSLEHFLRSASSHSGPGIGEGLAQMFGANLPPGVSSRQMEEMWKMLDDMAQNDPEEYKRFIGEQMAEMKTEIGKEKEAEDKKQTITGQAAFCLKIRVAKVVEEKDRKKESGGIKLFDF